jgi:autotransporter-associated beta strand protein
MADFRTVRLSEDERDRHQVNRRRHPCGKHREWPWDIARRIAEKYIPEPNGWLTKPATAGCRGGDALLSWVVANDIPSPPSTPTVNMKVRAFTLALLVSLPAASSATPVIRSATTDSLNVATAWVGDPPALPTTANTATWDAASTLANTLGANLAWGGIDISAASGTVAITGANSLAAGAVKLGANSLAITTNTANNSLTLSSLAGTGTLTINNGTANLGMAPLNTAGALNFNGTLQLRGGNATTAPSPTAASFFYLGRSGISQAAGTAFALDTGEGTGNAKDVILDGDAWNGKTIHLTSLSGVGSLRSDSGAAGTRTVRVEQATDTTFSGLVLSHASTANPNVVRRMVFEKHGSGKLTLAAIVGKQTQSAGAAVADIDLGVFEGTVALTANNTRTGATTVSSGATLEVGAGGGTGLIGGAAVTNDGTIIFNYGTSATVTIPNTFTGGGAITKQGEGRLTLSGNSSSFTGDLELEQGSLRLGPSLGAGTLTAKSGTFIAAALPTTNGTSQVGGLTLEGGTESDFRLGVTQDRIEVTAIDGLTVPGPGETHTININNDPLARGTITLIDYQGAALTADEFSRFVLGQLPLVGSFQLVNNTANTSIDLQITLQDQLWKGFTDGNWDSTTANWALESTPAVPAVFSEDNPAVFDDSATRFAVVLDGSGVYPLSVFFNNSGANPYTLTGGPIAGATSLAKDGSGTVTLAQDNAYGGGTTVNNGRLQIGNGGETGDLGGGAVVVAQDATLAYTLDATQLRDYKVTPKMRNVSGAGGIVIDGGFTFFNYTGTGVGFSDANSWNNFSGTLTVKGGSEFRTIRNGATAMGTAQIVLGDATGSGHLAQIEGNWTWTNHIQLVGAANEIRNRSANAPRTLKLQGVIAGSGGLVFTDPAASMTDNQRGFILTGANTLDGTITINPGVPVRVGGVPGDTDITQSGAGAGGSLGSATVVNEGTLTFSRSDSHEVANAIGGGGAVFVGLSADNTAQAMTYSGTATHGGGTTVRAGTLTIAPAGSIGGSSLTVASGAKLVIDGSSVGDTTSLDLGASALVEVTGTETVGTLFIDGIQMAAGTWGATGSDATHTDDTRFTGTGVVWVVDGPPPTGGYADWALTNAPAGGPTDDYDGDGVPNAVEYILGGTKDTRDSGKLPTAQATGGDFVFRFVRDQNSKTPDVTVSIEISTDLATWPLSYAVATAPEVATTDNGDGTETVTLTISRAPDAKKFARLGVAVE